jgi:hypothetical protein
MQREVKCQICPWHGSRYSGSGLLGKPCPECGSRTTFGTLQSGDMPVTPDPKLKTRQEPKNKAPNIILTTIDAWHSVDGAANGI